MVNYRELLLNYFLTSNLFKNLFTIIKKTNREVQLFLLISAFYLSLFLNLNNKTLILFFFIFIIILYWFFKDFKKALFLAFVTAMPIGVGKTYEIELVSAWQLNLPWRPYGIANFIVISIKEILIALMALIIIKDNLLARKNFFQFDIPSILLLFYFIFNIIAAIFGSIRPDISIILSLYTIEPLILYIFIKSNILNKNINIYLLMILASMVLFQTFIASLQFIKQSTLGLSIEISQEFLPLSMGIDEDIFTFRPLTTFYHANQLAQFMITWLFIFLPFVLIKLKRFTKLFAFIFISAFWTLILSMGRSAWLSVFVCLLIFLFIIEKRWHIKIKINRYFNIIILYGLPILIFSFIAFFLPRLVNTFFAFEVYGGAYTRLELVKESLPIIKEHFLFGIGAGMSVFYTFSQSIYRWQNDILSYFPEAVHNGYILLLLETGFIIFTLFLIISGLFIRKIVIKIQQVKNRQKVFYLALFLGLIAPFINNFFQSFLPDLQKIIICSIILTEKGINEVI